MTESNHIKTIMGILTTVVLVVTLIVIYSYSNTTEATERHLEDDYVQKFCTGENEVILENRSRADCELDNYAIEYDWAKKWQECIGQALEYSMFLKKTPGCVLIMKDENDDRFLTRILNVVEFWDLDLKVWTITWDSKQLKPEN